MACVFWVKLYKYIKNVLRYFENGLSIFNFYYVLILLALSSNKCNFFLIKLKLYVFVNLIPE